METDRVLFTKEMKKTYTILAPAMAPIHFRMIEQIFREHGYHLKILYTTHRGIVETGLQNVHNDTCYPALLVVGQLLEAINSGGYDKSKLAVMITQTGGGCRASNYIHLIRRALRQNGLGYIPVISLSANGMEKNPGFQLTPKFLAQLVLAVIYGDGLMWMSNQTRPYEVEQGATEALIDKWIAKLNGSFRNFLKVSKNLNEMARDFGALPLRKEKRVAVGIVGEIYVKYAPLGNNNLEEFLFQEGCEAVVPLLLDFLLYCCNHRVEDRAFYGIRKITQAGAWLGEKVLLNLQNKLIRAVEKHTALRPPAKFLETKELVRGYVSPGNKMGEGWLLTAEMLELVHSGVKNIVCTQPFGCLPNHIAGKGMIRKIRENNPGANIVAIDYDAGATKINQENRIKLMLSVARENLEAEQ